jgi:long-chain acyl-CoA synthetase
MADNFNLAHSTQFAVLPLYHAHALGFGLMSSLISLGHLVFTEKLDPFAWMEIIRSENVVFTSVVPTLLPILMTARVHQDKIPTLQALLVSSAPLSPELAQEFTTKTGIRLVQGWGLSEYTNFACCMSPDASPAENHALLFQFEGTSIGSPLSGAQVQVSDSSGEETAEGIAGELWVRGPSLMLGYYRDERATSLTRSGSWLKTGDEGIWRFYEGKKRYFVTGRIKEIIIRDAEKYSPLAIERKILHTLPELTGKLAVLGFAHDVHGEEIGAYLELANLPESLQSALEKTIQGLPLEQRPKVILYSEKPIPKTHTGKVQRGKLRELFKEYKNVKGPARIARAND